MEDILQSAKAENDEKLSDSKNHKILEQESVDCKEKTIFDDDEIVTNKMIDNAKDIQNQSKTESRSNNYQIEESGTDK